MGKSISRLAKIPTLSRDWLRLLKERVNYLSTVREKRGLKEIHRIAQIATLFVDLL